MGLGTWHDGVIELMSYVYTGCLRLHVETKKRIDRASEPFAFLRKQAAALPLSSNPRPQKQLPLFPFSPPLFPPVLFLSKAFQTSRIVNLL